MVRSPVSFFNHSFRQSQDLWSLFSMLSWNCPWRVLLTIFLVKVDLCFPSVIFKICSTLSAFSRACLHIFTYLLLEFFEISLGSYQPFNFISDYCLRTILLIVIYLLRLLVSPFTQSSILSIPPPPLARFI